MILCSFCAVQKLFTVHTQKSWEGSLKNYVLFLALSLYPPVDWHESKQLAWGLKSILEVTVHAPCTDQSL